VPKTKSLLCLNKNFHAFIPMKISNVSYNCNCSLVANRYYNTRISQFYATDPLAEKYYFQSPYTYATNNPVGLVDVDGLGTNENEDWIKNKKTGEYKWDNNVTKESETPEGYKYIGKKDSDIIFDFFGTNYFKTFIPASNIINKCEYFDINLKGIYNVNNTYLRQPSVFSLSGVANHTYLKKTIYFNN